MFGPREAFISLVRIIISVSFKGREEKLLRKENALFQDQISMEIIQHPHILYKFLAAKEQL